MSRFRRTLPDRPDLDQQKQQAKELLRAFRDGDVAAQARVRAELPDKPRIVLADAQYVLAREYGYASWRALREHIATQTSRTQTPLEQIRDALVRCDPQQVRRLLAEHRELRAMIDAPVFPFDSPALVHFAGDVNNLDMIDVLLEFGADPNRRSDWWAGGFHALHSASGALAERLLAAGAAPDACAAAQLDRVDLLAGMLQADPQRVHERGGDGQTPLHFARSRDVVDMLLDAGADPDARDVDHRSTPAQWMLQQRRGAGRYELARHLVERGAATDIFLAAALGLTERVRALVQADPSVLELRTHQGDYGEAPPSSFHIYTWSIGQNLSPFEVAAQFEQHATLDALRGLATPRQRFLSACARGAAAEARALLAEQPDIMATLRPEDHRLLPQAGWAANTPAVELMLGLGFDPAAPGQDAGTVLHCAAWEGVPDCVAAVLRHPVARTLVDTRDPTHGSTPLGWCRHGSLHSGNPGANHAAVARMLLTAGAAPETGDAHPDVRAAIDNWTR